MADQPLVPPSFRRWASRARTLAVVYFILLAIATHIPDVSTESFSLSDKVVHMAAYLLLTVLCLAGWELTIGRLEPKHFFAVWLAGTLYGAIDEMLQAPVGRDCDVHDWVADVAGVVTGLILYQLLRGAARRLFGTGHDSLGGGAL